ncbi:MAG TPA: ChaN family lipoprotein [Gemmatimonadales bacterium]|nr:ChaN family lipoprotein [Gemmatimonadales bacterium]
MTSRTLAALPLVLLLAACAPGRAATAPSPAASPGWDFRVVQPASDAESSLQDILARAGESDVVFFGEMHDDPETHRAEAELLEAIGRLGRPVVLSLEMFERDVQQAVDDYLAGRLSETAFLEVTRPWPRYATDYRPLVETAKANGWPVVASNVPRPLASAVGRKGLEALDTLTSAERAHAARDIQCPRDEYHERFMATMRGHGAGGGAAADSLPTAMAERFYLAQCVKDETMAEAIVNARRRAGDNAVVVHYNGAFHSDFGLGTASRVSRREAGWEILLITAVPTADPASATLDGHEGRAEYVIFTRDLR